MQPVCMLVCVYVFSRACVFTLCKCSHSVSRSEFGLQESVFGFISHFINQLIIISVWIHCQQLLLTDHIGRLKTQHNKMTLN